MTNRKLIATLVALVLSACAQNTKTAAPSPPAVTAEAPSPRPVQAVPAVDSAAVVQAERDLKALGYPAGKSGDVNDATLRRAILAFERDQGLAEDGALSLALEERLRQLRAAMIAKGPAPANRNALFVYSDGAVRSSGLNMLPPIPPGQASDAAINLLRPIRPASEASFHLGHRMQDGSFVATKTISCHTGRLIRSNTVFGASDLLAVDCHMEGGAEPAWHSLYSPGLDTVVEQVGAGKRRTLIAIRPSTANWPVAARTGLDWAITHALEMPASDTPLQWSSTGVAQHFEIRAFAKVLGRDVGLAGRFAAASCRHFELSGNDRQPSRYPGIACQNEKGLWTIAGTGMALSSPAKTVTMRTASPSLESKPLR
ncbi:MAG TPA: peptidoglycan-binding domain-containing protein [Rhizomicrobium sp.]|nr:peptidoglycan-binding domain-containing protein [Rhizomicrobium sp.]